MEDVAKCAVLLVMFFICGVKCNCTLYLNKDFGSPGPVLIKNNDFLEPNIADGGILIQATDFMMVACPGNNKRLVLGNIASTNAVTEAHCINNSLFRVDQYLVDFKDIHCNSQPFFNTVEESISCGRNSQYYGIGYIINKTFYRQYLACFDKSVLRTRYVQHRLTPMNIYSQQGLKRPQFIQGTLFGSLHMSAIYKQSNQKNRLDAILGRNMSAKYITKNQFLTRGHLAPRADFSTSAEMRATFHYVNAAPQWIRGNAGDWAALEEALRRRVQSMQKEVVVYTGVHGVMLLPDTNGQMKEIYLAVDENNNPILPVPMYYFKVVYNPDKKRATAFVTINSSFYNSTLINKLEFCKDVCADNTNFKWLKWRSADGTHSFCCDYKNFVRKVTFLPKLDVKGLFY